jgi:hypothetical protein
MERGAEEKEGLPEERMEGLIKKRLGGIAIALTAAKRRLQCEEAKIKFF